MREIKFRAWDKTENKMARSVKEMRFNHKGLYAVTLIHMGFEFKRRINDVILEQYTGLKDKNGKEIYEGDIVKCSNDADEIDENYSDTGIGIVEWISKFGFWNVSEIENGLGDLLSIGYIEIIGNIHENPELLEVQP